MKTTTYIYPEIDGDEYEVQLYIKIRKNSPNFEILDHDEDHPFESDEELKERAHKIIDEDTVVELVQYECERQRIEHVEQKLDQQKCDRVMRK